MAEQNVAMGNQSDSKSDTGSVFPYTESWVRNQIKGELNNVEAWVNHVNNSFLNINPPPQAFRQTTAREALLWMLRKEYQKNHQLGNEDKEVYTDLARYIVTVAKISRRPNETAKASAFHVLGQLRAVIDGMPDDLGKEIELEEAGPDESKSQVGFGEDWVSPLDSSYRDFYKSVAKELYSDGKVLVPYQDAEGKEQKLLLFDTVNEPIASGRVKDTIKHLVLFVRDIRDYLPYLYSADQATKTYPNLLATPEARKTFLQMVSYLLTRRVDLPALLRLVEAMATQALTMDQLRVFAEAADERLQLVNKAKALESELKSERENLALRSVIHTALEKFATENKANEKLVFEMLRDDSETFQRLEDLAKIYQFAKGRKIRIEDLWKVLDEYRTLDSKLKLQENKENIRKDIVALQALLDDHLLQPKTALQMLSTLLNNPKTASLGAVADTINQLERRNSDLSASFRRTLSAMASLLRVFSNVSKEYALRVGEFVQSFSDKVAETTRAWGLQADNPVAQFAAQLTRNFSTNYVEVKVGQDVKTQTLELTFNGQGLDLTTDAVFLQAASLLKWLDRFIVDPRRPADPGMAKLWNDVSEGLFGWQQAVIDAFVKTDVTGQAGPLQPIMGQVDAATRNLVPNMNQAMGKVGEMIRGAVDRFGRDLKAQDALLRQRVDYLLVNPALGQYALTVNGQDAKTQEAARTIFRSFIEATRRRLLDDQADEAKSVEVMAEIDKLANDMRQLKLESNVTNSENKRLQRENKELDDKYKVIKQANDAYDKKIRDAESSLITYATKTGVTLKPGLDEDIKRLLDFYEDTRQEFIKTRGLVSALANKYQVSVPGGVVLLSDEMKAVLGIFTAKYDNWTAASQKLRALSAGKLFPGGYQPTADLEKDVEVVLNAFRQTLADWEKVEKLVANYSRLVFEGKANATGILETDTKTVLDAYERYHQDFIALRDEENKWWTRVQDARFPVTRSLTDDERLEQKNANTLLSNTTGVLPLLAQRRDIVANWIGTLAKIIEENDRWNVKDLIQKAQGKSSGSSSSSSKPAAASASANPYYRVQFNGEVDTLTKDHVFPVFLPQTPFMRLWMFAREFAGAASNQLGNILEPLAPGLEVDDERTLFILRQYQADSKGKDKDNPTLPTGASRTEVARQELAAEDKKDLKETAEERLKIQKATALDYIKQLDNYNTLDEYETKVRQYFKNIALTAVVYCQELLQRTDLPEFRRITLAELINSPNLCSGFARMCGLCVLVKQGTVPGMISTQSSAVTRVLEFDEHARQLPRMYRRKGPYVWEVVRVPPSSFNTSTATSKRVRL